MVVLAVDPQGDGNGTRADRIADGTLRMSEQSGAEDRASGGGERRASEELSARDPVVLLLAHGSSFTVSVILQLRNIRVSKLDKGQKLRRGAPDRPLKMTSCRGGTITRSRTWIGGPWRKFRQR